MTAAPELFAPYAYSSGFVKRTDEFRRIVSIPWVYWEERDDLDELCDLLTKEYGTGEMRLWPHQAVILETLHDMGGAFGIIGVGDGKTLISYLAPSVVGARSTLLLVPANLRDDKTPREFRELSQCWMEPKNVKVESYAKISRKGGDAFLRKVEPDLIIADEGDALRNPDAACTKKIMRYVRETGARFLCMSGSVITRSLLDMHHLLAHALGTDHTPLPVPHSEVDRWARAVDEKVDVRARPGVLVLTPDKGGFFPFGKQPTLRNIRRAVGRRIQCTPGVIRTRKASIDCPIVMDFIDLPIAEKLKEPISRLVNGVLQDDGRMLPETPNGDIATPADVYRHVRSLVCGMYDVWDPPPPEDWLTARRAWNAAVREILLLDRAGLDSEEQVQDAVINGELSELTQRWERWFEVRPSYRINSKPVWIEPAALDPVIENVQDDTIIWVEKPAVGRHLSERFGFPFFHKNGLDKRGRFIDDASGTILASVAANLRGRNLQHKWHRNLVLSPEPNGWVWEQLLGRTHRSGQKAPAVYVDAVIGHRMIRDHMRQAFADAQFAEDVPGQKHKLLLADLVRQI